MNVHLQPLARYCCRLRIIAASGRTKCDVRLNYYLIENLRPGKDLQPNRWYHRSGSIALVHAVESHPMRRNPLRKDRRKLLGRRHSRVDNLMDAISVHTTYGDACPE
jgi:hypothetical protein